MRKSIFILEQQDKQPEFEVYLDSNADYSCLDATATLGIWVPGIHARREVDPDELLAVAKACMAAREEHIANLAAKGVHRAADNIWNWRHSGDGLGDA